MVAGLRRRSGAADSSAAGPGRADRGRADRRRADRRRAQWPGRGPAFPGNADAGKPVTAGTDGGGASGGGPGRRWLGWPARGGWCPVQTHRCPPAPTADDPGCRRSPAARTRTSAGRRPGSPRWCAAGRATMLCPDGCPIPGSPVHTGQSRRRRCMAQSPWSLTGPGPDAARGQCSRESQEKSRDR